MARSEPIVIPAKVDFTPSEHYTRMAAMDFAVKLFDAKMGDDVTDVIANAQAIYEFLTKDTK